MSDTGLVTVPNGAVLPFDKITLNMGGGFNHHTHAFVAPYSGNYWLYVRIDDNEFRSFEIRRNGHGVNRCDNDGGLKAITCGVVVTLKAGDTVTVNHVLSEVGQVDSGPESLFAGFMIH